jgi:signal peptide peptidase SppA
MDNELWLGSLSLYQADLAQQELVASALLAGTLSQNDYQDNTPENFTLFGNIAVIDVIGTLTNDDSWWTAMMGDTSYNQIRRSLIEAATHSDVQSIVLNIDSGGGTPNGLSDVGDMVRQITASGIPVHAYSGGIMASAAYWLGSSATRVHCGETANVGSIGVISIHKEYTDAFKKDGIKVTVFRAGEEKALSNPYEKLTEKARENIQAQIDALYDVFVTRIAEYRLVTPDFVRTHMADGREFIGQQAVDAGLADDITSLDDLITGLQSKIDKKTAGKETPMARKSTVLTQAQRDAMMEGVPTPVALAIEPTTEPETTPEAEPTLEVPAADPALDTTPETVEPEAETNLVAFLRAELATKYKEVTDLTIQNATLNNDLNVLKTSHEPMKKLVATSISRMQIALGAPMMDMSDLPAEVVLAQHAKITQVFCNKFPVGGVAAVEVDEPQTPVSVSPVSASRMRQAKI